MSQDQFQHEVMSELQQEMTMNKIAPAFIKAKKAFAPALKTSTNPHFKSKYAALDACIEAVNDAFLDNGIAMYQETFEDQTGITVETVFLHESGEIIRSGKLHVPASKQDPQGYGSALTYARRYSLMAACGIAPEDDDGNAASKPVKPAVFDESKAITAMRGAKDVQTLNRYYQSALAEIVGEHVKKGQQVYAEGRIKTKKCTDKDGIERYVTNIEATEMKMLGRRDYDQAKESEPAKIDKSATVDDLSDDIPF